MTELPWCDDIHKIPEETIVMGWIDEPKRWTGDKYFYILGVTRQYSTTALTYHCTSYVKVENATQKYVGWLNSVQSNLPTKWRALTTEELIEFRKGFYATNLYSEIQKYR